MGKVIDIYKGKDPRELPTYTLTDVATYLRVPRSTLAAWAGRKAYPVKGPDGTRVMQPLFLSDQDTGLLTFNSLVEAYILTSFTRAIGIRLPKVREALKRAGGVRPLLDNVWHTDGKDLFIDAMGSIINVSQYNQVVVREFVKDVLHRVDFDPSRRPVAFSPWREKIGEPRVVDVDPRRAFGRPTVSGRSLKVDTIIDLLAAGEPVARIARNYALKPEVVRAVGRWGEDAQAAA